MESERLVISGPGPGPSGFAPFLGVTATAPRHTIHCPALSVEIVGTTVETVDLSVLVGTTIVFIDQVVSHRQQLQAISSVGAEFPAHACAPGKVLLASCADEDACARSRRW